MANHPLSPTWLTEPCPPWCVREHREDDHPEDRKHESDATLFPAVVATFDPKEERSRPCEFVVTLSRRVGAAETWLFIGEAEGGEHRILTTPASAVRLLGAVSGLVHASLS